jgi:sulfatase maturation enzyme AslB (radical SAM superfamily)
MSAEKSKLQTEGRIEVQNPDDLVAQPGNASMCLYPFVQVSTIPSGFVRPCCYYTKFLIDNPDPGNASDMPDRRETKKFNVSRDSVKAIWESEHMAIIRRQMLAGKPLNGCNQCYREDQVGSTSLRQRSFREWGHHPGVQAAVKEAGEKNGYTTEPVRYFELKPGNLCNLKCRMCNQFDSSKVASEMLELSEKYGVPHMLTQARMLDQARVEADFDISRMPDWSKLDAFWEEADTLLPHLETISIAGGEPMLLQNVIRFLDRAVKTGHSRHMKVFLASNFTHFNDDFFEIASNFELFEFIASVDGFGETQEYIRFPSKWPIIAENFKKAKARSVPNRLKALTNITLQILNVMTVTELLDWIDELELEEPHFHQHPYFLNILSHPSYLAIQNLPAKAREIAIERFEAYRGRSRILAKFPEMSERIDLIVEVLKAPPPADYEKRLREFVKTQSVLDEHRSQSLQQFNPELFKIVQDELRDRFQSDWIQVAREVSL